MDEIVRKAQEAFFRMINDFGSDPYNLSTHVPEVEKWAKRMIEKYHKTDGEVVLLAVWLHDIGHYPVPTEIDHAVRGEERARAFLEQEHYPKEKMVQVLHCVRAHRCSDVLPHSFEAKLIACADSASHMTDSMYYNIAKGDKYNKREFRVYAKIDRDYRDLSAFPEIQQELKELCVSWKLLLGAYEKIDLK